MSLTDFNMFSWPRFVGLSNYFRMFLDDDVFTIALRNTIILTVVTGPTGFLMSFIFAWGINELRPRFRSMLTLAFYAPTLAGSVYFIWKFIFAGDSYGLLNSWLLRLGFTSEAIAWLTDPKYNMTILIILILWMSAGAGFLAFIAGLQSLDSELFEAGAIDGIRNRFQELWFITLPQMKPQILLASVFTIAGAFSIGAQSSALLGFPSTDNSGQTLLLHILDYGWLRREFGYASAVQLFLLVIMLVTFYTISKLLAKWGTSDPKNKAADE